MTSKLMPKSARVPNVLRFYQFTQVHTVTQLHSVCIYYAASEVIFCLHFDSKKARLFDFRLR